MFELYIQPAHYLHSPAKIILIFFIDRSCYYDNDRSDAYVVRPFPSMLKCGVIVPFGLDLMSFDTKHLQGFSRSLEILTYMRKAVKTFGLSCGELLVFLSISANASDL
jgi:hypothetical protein